MKNNKFLIYLTIFCIVVASLFLGIKFANKKDNSQSIINQNIIETIVNEKEVENPSTTKIPNLTQEDEQTVEVQETEAESFQEQGEIAYNGSDKTPNVNVGEYSGLTYYSQIDGRWKNKMYSIVGDSSQTIGTSGCGPTSAAMVVSSIKGNFTPESMADLYVKYGYRTANNGTYWSAFKWTADVFDIGYSETNNLDVAINKLKDNNYVIVSCNQGLFTYGGHFIVIVGIDGDTLKIYDPYLYSGKFNVSSRRGKVTVSGNTVYCSLENFKNYANARGYFCFKNDRKDIKENNTIVVETNNVTSNVQNVNYTAKITANSGLNIRSGASTSYNRIGGYSRNSIVTILAESNGWGKTDRGWISLAYVTKVTNLNNSQTTIGNTKKLARNCNLYSNSNLTGTVYNYKANTTVTILQNITSTIDKVRVNKTGRVAYIDNSNFTNVTIKSARGTIKKINACTLYSNSDLSGVKYNYKANTTVTVLQNVNSNVDKIQVNKTGRIAYINVRNYK